MTTNINELAKDARCINDADWGSPRQIEAENRFFAAVEDMIPRKQFGELESYCLKATTDEMIDEALRLVALSEEIVK